MRWITDKVARTALGVGFGIAITTCSFPAMAAVVLDQKVVVPHAGTGIVGALIGERSLPGLPGSYSFSGAQTFTAGVTGILDHIDFQAFNRDPFSAPSVMKLSLINGDYAAGARDVLLTTEISSDTLPEGPAAAMGALGLSFDTSSAGYTVAYGQRYSVRFEGVTSNPGAAGLVVGYYTGSLQSPEFFGPGYAGGEWIDMVEPVIDGLVIPAISYDVGFASYVLQADTGAVPEPATWLLMIAGFGAIGGALRSRSGRRLRHA